VADRDLHLRAAPVTSDEGVPLANGLLGALVWGNGRPLTISLDRTDLWDLRAVPEFCAPDYRRSVVLAMHRAGAHDDLIKRLEKPYYRPGPTKIPAGRIEIVVPEARFVAAELDVADPVAAIDLHSARVDVAVHATQPVGLIRVAAAVAAFRLVVPAFDGRPDDWQAPTGFDASHADVWDLGYPPTRSTAGDGFATFVQRGHGGFSFAVALHWRAARGGIDAAWSIATSAEAADPLALAALRAGAALDTQADLMASHTAWWADYWSRGRIELPDAEVERIYRLDMYKFGAAARRGGPPIALQGPWTVDNGRLPPWKGDYHHDLNTQMSYWPALTGNQVEAHAGFLDWLWDTRDACRAWTRQFFEVDGLNVPMTADLLNRQIGGWRQYTHSLASGAWLAHHFAAHWRYTGDRDFLEARAYPYLAEVCTFIECISRERDGAGRRSVVLSSSPETHGNAPEAWFDRFTTYDLTLFRAALAEAAAMARALDRPGAAAEWLGIAAELPVIVPGPGGALPIASGEPQRVSHRHFSHLVGIYPLAVIDPWRSSGEAATARASIAELDALGSDLWMGYSFAWLACLKARCGDGNGALAALRTYADGFLLPNSFHANGDFAGKGYSKAVFRAFTLEGNCGAAAAIHEMLLQSHNGVVRLFPAVPADWYDVAFDGMLASGAVAVAARMAAGRLVDVTLATAAAGTVRLTYGRDGESQLVPVPAGLTRLDERLLARLNGDGND